MPEEIYHHTIKEIFKKIGEVNFYLPIKEFALSNLITELTDERVDLVWIDRHSSEIKYAFEFETSSNWEKSREKLWKIDNKIKKYIFVIKKRLNFEQINAVYINDDNSLDFLKFLQNQGINVSIQGVDMSVLNQKENEN